MKGILVFLLCSSVVETENCPKYWTEFCTKNLFHGCYRAYSTKVNYTEAYSVCALDENTTTLFEYNLHDQAEIDFVSNLTEWKTIWTYNGQNPATCYTFSGYNQTKVQESCNKSAYTVCKYDITSSTQKIACSATALTTLSQTVSENTTSIMENTTNIMVDTTNTMMNTTDIVQNTTNITMNSANTAVQDLSTDSIVNIYTSVSPSNGTTSCACEQVCYLKYSADDLEIKVLSIKQNLTVDPATLSATLRKLTCAQDPRPSSTYIGYTGAIIMSMLLLVIVVIDLLPKAKRTVTTQHHNVQMKI